MTAVALVVRDEPVRLRRTIIGEQYQARPIRRDNIEIPIAININGTRIEAEAGAVVEVDFVAGPGFGVAIEVVVVGAEQVVFAGVFAFVAHVALAGDELGLLVAV